MPKLTESQRLRLIRKVYRWVIDNTETFEEQNIGADLAYLLGAISKNSQCEWDDDRPFLEVLGEGFKSRHVVWSFIEVTTGKKARITRLKTALKRIEESYGTLDFEEVWNEAACKRTGTSHVETPNGSGSLCGSCGGPVELLLDPDPIYHPEQYLAKADSEVGKLLVTCRLCNRWALAETAHLHQGEYIGDACCWVESMRLTE